MRVLITGKHGQLGAALAQAFAPIGDLLVTARQDMDFTHPETIAPFLDANKPALIINTATYTQVDEAESKRDLAFAINETAPYELAQWAKSHNVPFVHYSTDYVFDGSGTAFWREDDPTNPLSVYGASKLAGELAISSVGDPTIILRTSWIYSAFGQCFLTKMLRLGAERSELSIVNDQIGAPTSADWLATITAGILIDGNAVFNRDAFDNTPQLYHVAPTDICSWYDFAETIFSAVKDARLPLAIESLIPIPSEDYPSPAQRPLNSRLNTEKFSKRFSLDLPNWRAPLNDVLKRRLA